MTLTPYQAKVLARELAKPIYVGITADQGWAWLTQPVVQSPVSTPNGRMITPLAAAALIGPTKAEAIALALKQTYPTIADHLLAGGIDPINTQAQAFLQGLVTANVITQADVQTLAGYVITVIQPPNLPPRFVERFDPSNWPNVAADGSAGGPEDPPLSGFPNLVLRSEFDAAWLAAGRS
jgi:hypothetical protein